MLYEIGTKDHHATIELQAQLEAAGLPVAGIRIETDDKRFWHIDYVLPLTPTGETLAAEIVAAFTSSAIVKPKSDIELLIEHLVSKGIVVASELPEQLQEMAEVPVVEAKTWTQVALDWLLGR
jgi:hypothetical protein